MANCCRHEEREKALCKCYQKMLKRHGDLCRAMEKIIAAIEQSDFGCRIKTFEELFPEDEPRSCACCSCKK